MNADELRTLQAPFKERYRDDPQTARITLRAEGHAGEGVTCQIQTGQALLKAGLHPATGGSGLEVCSGETLLQALVGCAGVTLRAVATSLAIPLNSAIIRAEADMDMRGTLAVSKEVPVGLQSIRLQFELATTASAEQIATLIRLTERYCVVYQTLKNPPPIEVTQHAAPQA